MTNNIIKFSNTPERRILRINGLQYDTYYLSHKSMLPDIDMDYYEYYDFDKEEHGSLYGFLFVKRIVDNKTKVTYYDVLFDPDGEIVGLDIPIDAIKASAVRYVTLMNRID